jgi:SAM-dependent methyltransferase
MSSKSECYSEPLSTLLRYLPPTGRILDAGSGDCFYARNLKKTNDNILCLDLSNGGNSDLPFCRGSITELPIRSGSIDLVYCITVLQYIHDDAQALEEFSRILKPKGRLIFSVPTRHSMFRIIRELEIFFDIYPFRSSWNIKPYTYYSRRMITRLAEKNFTILEFRGYEYHFSKRLALFCLNCARKNRYLKNFLARILTVARQKFPAQQQPECGPEAEDRKMFFPQRKFSPFADLSYHYLLVLEKT